MEKESEPKGRYVNNHAPFSELIDSDIKGPSSEFYQDPKHPELVIRESFIPLVEKYHEEQPEDKIPEYWAERAKDFKALGEKYGLHIAKTDFVIGRSPKSGQKVLFAVTDRIEGENLKNIVSIPKEAEKEVDGMYKGIFSHIADSYRDDEYYWDDFRNDQVVYGKAPKEEESHPYIVDVDLNMHTWENAQLLKKRGEEAAKENKEYRFWEQILMVLRAMNDSEEKIEEKHPNFSEARAKLEEIIKTTTMPTGEKAREMRLAVLFEKNI